jgi:predicted AAA+ superfamily ATPase
MKRACSDLLGELLSLFPCVAVVGVRQCGKTTLLQSLAEPWRIFDFERVGDFQLISRDPDLFFRLHGDAVALDEAQLLPSIFPALRVAIDADRNRCGRFIITGSSSPELISAISESLAGRVAIIEMGPLSSSESFTEPVSDFYHMIQNQDEIDALLDLPNRISLENLHQYWFRGGYPEPWVKHSPRFTKLWMQNYIQTYVNRDIIALFPALDRQKYQLFVHMLASLSGQMINYAHVARALGVSQPTAKSYFQIAHGTFIWRHIPAFSRHAEKRISKQPKGYVRDAGLLHYMLHLNTLDDLLQHPGMMFSWESMVIETIMRNFNALGVDCTCSHYRTSGGAEVDLILEGEFGLLPIEIKYGQHIQGRQLRSLRDFVREQDCRFGIVVCNIEQVTQLDDQIVAIPFGCL